MSSKGRKGFLRQGGDTASTALLNDRPLFFLLYGEVSGGRVNNKRAGPVPRRKAFDMLGYILFYFYFTFLAY